MFGGLRGGIKEESSTRTKVKVTFFNSVDFPLIVV